MRRRPTTATARVGTTLVICPDEATVIRTSQVIGLLEQPGATYRSVATELGITVSALHRYIAHAGFKRVGSTYAREASNG